MLLFDPTFSVNASFWNNLPGSFVDFSSLTNFVRTVKLADLSDYQKCF